MSKKKAYAYIRFCNSRGIGWESDTPEEGLLEAIEVIKKNKKKVGKHSVVFEWVPAGVYPNPYGDIE